MNCPKCNAQLNFIHEELLDVDLENGNLHTSNEYICPQCQRTFLTASYYKVNFVEEYFVEGDE